MKTIQFLVNKERSGKHVDMDYFMAREATEIKLNPVSASFFNIDGEVFPNDELYIKLLPGFINLVRILISQ